MEKDRLKNLTIIASGKGGVGKTWISISLAQTLAKKGKKVLLFDGDLGLANIDIQLGLMPRMDLGNFLKDNISFDQAITRYTPKNENRYGTIDIISGRSGSGILADISKSELIFLKDSLQALSNKYDYMIVDLGAGLDTIVQEFSRIGGQCLVVVTDEPTSLTDAYAFIKIIGQKNPDLPMKVIVNMAESQKQGVGTYSALSKVCDSFLKRIPGFVGSIRRDNCVRESIKSQIPIFVKYPLSNASMDIEKIVQNLENE
jgi:flagellar biosynthesis protein FlhG